MAFGGVSSLHWLLVGRVQHCLDGRREGLQVDGRCFPDHDRVDVVILMPEDVAEPGDLTPWDSGLGRCQMLGEVSRRLGDDEHGVK